ncbi:MAG: hypothetical protein AAF725_10520 [Acidobacteriota bacterium]
MTIQEHPSQDVRHHRHARDTSTMAPKPGHHLGTASFTVGDQSVILWLIEGPENDTISVNAMLSDFDLTRYLRFRIEGTAIEALNDLPFSPAQPRLELELEVLGTSDLQPTSALILFSTMRAPNGRDPDAAIARFHTESRGDLVLFITELRRGWEPVMTVISSFLALAHCVGESDGEQQCRLTVTDPRARVEVHGDFVVTGGLRSSLAL